MKRVCTLRKVLRSLSKVLLEKLFYRSYIVAFIATQFLLFLSYLQPGDIPYTTRTEWRQKATTYKNNKNLVVIKSHTIYKNDKITFLRGPLKEKEELF